MNAPGRHNGQTVKGTIRTNERVHSSVRWILTHGALTSTRSLSPRSLTLACSYTAIVGHFSGLHSRNPCNYYSLADPGGMEGWVGLVVCGTVCPQGGHLLAIDRAQVGKIPAAEDWHPNHGTTPPTRWVYSKATRLWNTLPQNVSLETHRPPIRRVQSTPLAEPKSNTEVIVINQPALYSFAPRKDTDRCA